MYLQKTIMSENLNTESQHRKLRTIRHDKKSAVEIKMKNTSSKHAERKV